VEGFLDDYAFLCFGLLELYEATFDERYLQAATALTKTMVAQFWDAKSGGFYFTKEKAEIDLPRLKQAYDGAVPSGNSVAVLNLLRLSRLANDSGYEELAAKAMRVFADEIQGSPTAYTFLLAGVDFAFGPTYSVVVAGDLKAKDTQNLLSALHKPYLPNVTVSLQRPEGAGLGYEQLEGKATAYVCQGQTCLAAHQ
jgi:uncharacterized protein YyaL (SSP411 family)